MATDDVDAAHRRVRDAAGQIPESPHGTRFGPGARAYVRTVMDPGGNLWTFGAYRGPSPS